MNAPQDELQAGDTGYVIANMKSSSEIKIGDTLTEHVARHEPLPGFKEIQPMVFSGIYPVNSADFEPLKAAMGKLQLNDSSFVYQAESIVALGFGFRCGFLGLLHMEIIQERLRREYNMDIIATYPSVIYEVQQDERRSPQVDNPEFSAGPEGDPGNSRADRHAVHHGSRELTSGYYAVVMDKRGSLTIPSPWTPSES